MPFKTWAYLEKVSSADFQTYLQNQVVATFTTTAQRDAQITVPLEGQMCYVAANKTRYIYYGVSGSGGAWVSVNELRGGIYVGSQVAAPASPSQLTLINTLNGAATWLAANMVTIPAGAGGLYLIQLTIDLVSPTVIACAFELRNNLAQQYAPQLRLAGMVNPGNPTNTLHATWLRQCADLDAFRVYCMGNAVTGGSAQVTRFSLARIGDDLATA